MNLTPHLFCYCRLLFGLLVTVTHLSAQTPGIWVGLQHGYFQTATNIRYDTLSGSLGGRIDYLDDHMHEFSLGVHARWVGEQAVYHEVYASLNSMVDKEGKQFLSTFGVSPEVGRRATEQRLRLGYRFGKMFPWTKRLGHDLGLGLSLEGIHRDTAYLALQSTPGMLKVLSVEAHVHAGLNYRLHSRINLGFHFSLFSFVVRRYRHRKIDELGRITKGGEAELDAFGSVKDWRNFRISYLLNGA